MHRIPLRQWRRCAGALVTLAAMLALTACNSKPVEQVKKIEPPRNAEPFRSPSPKPPRNPGAAEASTKDPGTTATIDAGGNASNFDFYLLALSWAPEFCASHPQDKSSSECDPSRHYGFVVHGLWPQNNDSTYPVSCSNASPVAVDVVRQMLTIMPDRGLIQHEWAVHGTCSGLTSREYFSLIQQAFRTVKIPDDYQHPGQAVQASPADIEQKFASANGAPADAFRVSCSKADFIGVDVCLTKDLQFQSCGNAVRECHSKAVKIVPASQ